MKPVFVAFLLLCVALVKGLETMDAEEIKPTVGGNEADREVEVVTTRNREDTNTNRRSPCKQCWEKGAQVCKIHEKTTNDKMDILVKVTCLKDNENVKDNSFTKPNPFPGVEIENNVYLGHFNFNYKSNEPQ